MLSGSNTEGLTTAYGSVFEQYPTLRPATKVQTSVKPRMDAEGKHCLAIQLQTAKAKRRGAADPEKLLARAEAEAAKQAAKAEIRQKIAAAKSGGATGARTRKANEAPPAPADEQVESEAE
ncbi:MAG: hypothetical protein K0R39_4103 [Symbiobacteriaceae bacterium]|jgi:hypothetical protein|nr:hypothetical protein [Symbiobacteriaceae bacterium]